MASADGALADGPADAGGPEGLDAPPSSDAHGDVTADAAVRDATFDAEVDAWPDSVEDNPDGSSLDARTDVAMVDAQGDASADDAPDAVPSFDAAPDVVPSVDGGPPCVVPDGGSPVGYAATVEPITTAHCAVAMCHDAITKEANLDLSVGQGYDALVCRNASIGCPGGTLRVVPLAPDRSVMWLRVSGGGCYNQMPLGSDGRSHPLPAALIDAIDAWITAGALP